MRENRGSVNGKRRGAFSGINVRQKSCLTATLPRPPSGEGRRDGISWNILAFQGIISLRGSDQRVTDMVRRHRADVVLWKGRAMNPLAYVRTQSARASAVRSLPVLLLLLAGCMRYEYTVEM